MRSESDRLAYYVPLLRRYRYLLLSIVTIFIGAGVALSYAVAPRFTATALLGIKSIETQPIEISTVVKSLPTDPFTVATESHKIESAAFVARAVDRLDLVSDPEFSTGLASSQPQNSTSTNEHRFAPPPAYGDERSRVTAAVMKGLDVQQLRGSNAIEIRFTSVDREKSALIANSLAQQYVNEQLQDKLATAEQVRMALESRLSTLRNSMLSSKATLEQYRADTGMIEVDNRDGKHVTLTIQSLSYLNEQYVQAQLQLSAEETQLQELDNLVQLGGNIEAAPAVLSSELVLRLREQEAEIIRRQGDAIKAYGEQHPELQGIRAELKDVRANIRNEIRKIVAEMRNTVTVSRAREMRLREQLAQHTARAARENQFLARLTQLENDADSYRSIYEAFLTRTKEVLEQGALYAPDAELISHAMTPTKKSFPPRKLIALFSLLAGTSVALLTILMIDRLRPKVRGAEQLMGLSSMAVLGGIPTVGNFDARNPPGIVSAAYQDLLTRIMSNREGASSTVLMITSSNPNEGKTSAAVGLAHAALAYGSQCLLVDCDLRCPKVHELFDVDREPGMVDLLGKTGALDYVVQHDRSTGIDFVTAGRSGDKTRLRLNATRIAEILQTFGARYPLVIIDTPPLLVVPDALLWAMHSDAVLLAVRWESTKPRCVVAALRELGEIDEVQLFGLLTMVNTRIYARYGFPDARRYSKRYERYYLAG